MYGFCHLVSEVRYINRMQGSERFCVELSHDRIV